MREELSRNCVLRSGGDGEFDGCRRWRVDAQAGGTVEHLWMFFVAGREMSTDNVGNYGIGKVQPEA